VKISLENIKRIQSFEMDTNTDGTSQDLDAAASGYIREKKLLSFVQVYCFQTCHSLGKEDLIQAFSVQVDS
jgi:hypothetical protein